MRFVSPTLLAAAILSASAAARAAPAAPVTVGDGFVDARRLQPYDNAFVATMIKLDGTVRVAGVWSDHLRLTEARGAPALIRMQAMAYETGVVEEHVNTFDRATFAPISDFQRNPDGSAETWSVDGVHVEGKVTPKPGVEPKTSRFETKARGFDFNCCMRSLIPAAMRLKVGETIRVSAIPMADGDPDEVVYRVLRRERVDAGWRGRVDAWVLETDIPGLPGGVLHFWIADEAPYLVRMTLIGTIDGSGKRYDQSFDMLGATRPATLN